jgi:hypothetical protein
MNSRSTPRARGEFSIARPATEVVVLKSTQAAGRTLAAQTPSYARGSRAPSRTDLQLLRDRVEVRCVTLRAGTDYSGTGPPFARLSVVPSGIALVSR